MQRKLAALAAVVVVVVLGAFAFNNTREGFMTGLRAPDFAVYDAEGGSVRLADSAGRYRLINFWAWWCGPCIDEMESLHDLERKLAGEVEFIYVGINRFYRDEQPLDPTEIAEGYRPSLEQFREGLRSATLVRDDADKNRQVVDHLLATSLFDFRGYWERQFRARTNERYGIPVTYLIDPAGQIRLVVHTAQNWLEHEQMMRDFAAGKDLSAYESRFVIPPELLPGAE